MATTLDVVDAKGKKTGSVDLPGAIFDVQTNVPLIHQVVTAQLAAARQGTHKTKGRGEVSGAGRKPFKQKGTGRARQGSIRAPQHRGGGMVHSRDPRDYSERTPKKMIAAALLGVLSDRARGERLHVIDSFGSNGAPSTKNAVSVLENVATSKNVLIVIEHDDEITLKSVRNLKNVHVLTVDQLNAYDVVVSDDIVFTKAAYDWFVSKKQGAEKAEPAKAEKADAEPKAEKAEPKAEKAEKAEPKAEKPVSTSSTTKEPKAKAEPAAKAEKPAAKAAPKATKTEEAGE